MFWKDHNHILDAKNPQIFINSSWRESGFYECFLVWLYFAWSRTWMNTCKSNNTVSWDAFDH